MEKKYKQALERIAEHYNGCDLSGDNSSFHVLRIACTALNWQIEKDQYGQVKLNKGGK